MQGSEDEKAALDPPKDYEKDIKSRLRHIGIIVDENEVELSEHILGVPFSLKSMPTIYNPTNTIKNYVELRELFCRDRKLSENSSATSILEYLKQGGQPIKDGFGGGGKTKKRIKSKKRKSNRKSRKSKRRKTRRKKR